MDKNEIEEMVIKICENIVFDLSENSRYFTIDTKLNMENGIDSLTLVNILIDIENIFEMNIDDIIDELPELKTIGNLIDLVKDNYKRE